MQMVVGKFHLEKIKRGKRVNIRLQTGAPAASLGGERQETHPVPGILLPLQRAREAGFCYFWAGRPFRLTEGPQNRVVWASLTY